MLDEIDAAVKVMQKSSMEAHWQQGFPAADEGDRVSTSVASAVCHSAAVAYKNNQYPNAAELKRASAARVALDV